MIEKVKIFANNNDKSKNIEKKVIEELKKLDFKIVEKNFDLAIAIGGDGSFLRMVKDNNFDSNVFFVGINAGTLGFMQEIKAEESFEFFMKLKQNNFLVEETKLQQTEVFYNKTSKTFYSLNEIVIRDFELNSCRLKIEVDGTTLEHFVGDGILVSTSVGSTAYNLSFGGSIVYSSLHTLQITPIAPLNSKAYRDLLNSIILPEDKHISITPEDANISDLLLNVDGENFTIKNVSTINTFVSSKSIKLIKLKENNFIQKINDKFLKD